MKKRFIVALALISPVGLFSILVAVAVAQTQVERHACANGNQAVCQTIAERRARRAERDAKREAEQKAERKAEAEREAKQKADRAAWDAQRAREKGADLSVDDVVRCEFLLKRQLNDPDSYRKLNNITEVMRSGVIRYTATNGFGGRVQAVHHCG